MAVKFASNEMFDFGLWLGFCFNVGVFGVQWHEYYKVVVNFSAQFLS